MIGCMQKIYSNLRDVAVEKEWRAIPDETGHYWEEALSL